MTTLLESPAAVGAASSAPFGFQLSDDQLAVRKMVREFAESEIAPHVMEWDEAQVFPREVIARLGDLGMLGVIVPEAYGGAGLSYIDYIGVIEELSRVDGCVGISVAAHNSLCTNHLFMFGTEEQRRRWVTPLAQGKMIGAWGLTEAEAGSDSKGTKTTAVLDGNEWVLNGSKNFITHGSVGDVAVLMAVTDRAAGTHGISAFVVDLHQPGHPRRQEGEQARPQGVRHGDARHGRLPDPEGEPPRAARHRVRPGHAGPRRRADLDRGPRPRDGRRGPSTAPSTTPGSASSSASRSPSSSRSRTTSPTWRPRSTPPASSPGAPGG